MTFQPQATTHKTIDLRYVNGQSDEPCVSQADYSEAKRTPDFKRRTLEQLEASIGEVDKLFEKTNNQNINSSEIEEIYTTLIHLGEIADPREVSADKISVQDLLVPTKSANALIKHGIETARDLSEQSDFDLSQVKRICPFDILDDRLELAGLERASAMESFFKELRLTSTPFHPKTFTLSQLKIPLRRVETLNRAGYHTVLDLCKAGTETIKSFVPTATANMIKTRIELLGVNIY